MRMKAVCTILLLFIQFTAYALSQSEQDSPKADPQLVTKNRRALETLAFVLVNYEVVQRRYAIPKIDLNAFLEIPDSHILYADRGSDCRSFSNKEGNDWQKIMRAKDPNLPERPINGKSKIFICVMNDEWKRLYVKAEHLTPLTGSYPLIFVSNGLYAKPLLKELWKHPDVEQDFLEKWEAARYDLRDIISDKSPEHAELIYHFILMTQIVTDLNFFLSNGNLETTNGCLQIDPKNEPGCAALLEDTEIESFTALYHASEILRIPYTSDRYLHLGKFLPYGLQKEMRGDRSEKGIRSAIKKFVRSILPKLYPEKASAYQKYWQEK